MSTLITAVLFLIYIVGSDLWNRLLSMETATMVLMFAYFVFFPAFNFWSVRQRVENKYVSMVLITLLVSILIPGVSILLLYTTALRHNAVIWGYLFVQSGVGLFFYVLHLARGKCLFHKDYWIKALKFNIPLIPHYLSLIILGQADRIMIQHYHSTEKAGIYNLAYQVSMIMNIFINAINNTLVPWSYEQFKKKNYSAVRNSSTLLCVLIGVMTFGATLIAPELISILGTAEYKEAIWIIPAVAISVYFTFCYGLFCTIEFYYSATWFVMVASAVGAILNIILNAIFIPIFGFIAAGYTTLFCYFVFMVMHFAFTKQISRKYLDNASIYNNKFIFLSCFVLCFAGALCMLLYNGWVLRYLLIAAIAFAAFLLRNKIIHLLKSMKK